MSDHSVVIVAGGSGTRMNADLPKQFIEIQGAPIVVHTIRAFLTFDPDIELILVLPASHFSTWEAIQSRFLPNQPITVTAGGETRFQSVKAGLEKVSHSLVAIHDAVRPCVTPEVIKNSFESAIQHGSGLVTVPLKDSIREVLPNETKARDRSMFRSVQTPQTFRTDLIKKAFLQAEKATFTDDATVFEEAGYKVFLVDGSYENIKITTQDDLRVAEGFLKTKNSRG